MKTQHKLLAVVATAITAAYAAPTKSAKGYQITGPTGWTLNKSGLMGTDLFFWAPRKNNYATNLNVIVSPVPKGMKIETIRAQTVAMMPKLMDKFKMGAMGYSTVAGARAMTLKATYNMGTPPRRLQMSQVSALRNNTLFVFTHTSLVESASKTEPAFQKALQSVKWTK